MRRGYGKESIMDILKFLGILLIPLFILIAWSIFCMIRSHNKKKKALREKEVEEVKFRLSEEEVRKALSDAYSRNCIKGKYIRDKSAQPGSIDNPYVVGDPDNSDILVYDGKNDKWLLTDGYGNGVIR